MEQGHCPDSFFYDFLKLFNLEHRSNFENFLTSVKIRTHFEMVSVVSSLTKKKSDGLTIPIVVMNQKMVKGKAGVCRLVGSVQLYYSSIFLVDFPLLLQQNKNCRNFILLISQYFDDVVGVFVEFLKVIYSALPFVFRYSCKITN